MHFVINTLWKIFSERDFEILQPPPHCPCSPRGGKAASGPEAGRKSILISPPGRRWTNYRAPISWLTASAPPSSYSLGFEASAISSSLKQIFQFSRDDYKIERMSFLGVVTFKKALEGLVEEGTHVQVTEFTSNRTTVLYHWEPRGHIQGDTWD